MRFKSFSKEQHGVGFFIHRYANGREKPVYVASFHQHYKNCRSYFTTHPNDRDKGKYACHDFGQYSWVNNYSSSSTGYGPTEWREMTPIEALAMGMNLYRFGRPSWAHKYGKDVVGLINIILKRYGNEMEHQGPALPERPVLRDGLVLSQRT